jgi:hypothetical protein
MRLLVLDLGVTSGVDDVCPVRLNGAGCETS